MTDVLPIARWKEAGQLAYHRIQDDWPPGILTANLLTLAVVALLSDYLTESERKQWESLPYSDQKKFVVHNVL